MDPQISIKQEPNDSDDVEKNIQDVKCLAVVKCENVKEEENIPSITVGNYSEYNKQVTIKTEDSKDTLDGYLGHRENNVTEIIIYEKNRIGKDTDYADTRGNEEINEVADDQAGKYQCKFCKFFTKRKHSLVRHFKVKHSETSDWYHCHSCKYKSKDRSSLTRHIKHHCKKISTEQSHDTNQSEHIAEESGNVELKEFLPIYEEESNIPLVEANYDIEQTTIKREFTMDQVDSIDQYNAVNYNYDYHTQESMPEFIAREENPKNELVQMYQCTSCSFATKLKHSLMRHFRTIHSDTSEWFTCQHCQYRTKERYQLTRHVRTLHNDNPREYECPICHYKTKYKCSLDHHVKRKHTQNFELHKCHQCVYTSKYKESLNRHIRRKHNPNVKLHQCTHCEFKTDDKSTLKKHIQRRHDENYELLQCQFCEMKIKDKHILKKHVLRKHNNTFELYLCDQCKFETKDKCNLKRHIRTVHRNTVK